MTDRPPLIVGLAGGTGSGKTTVTEALLARLGDRAVVLQHDWYYRDQRDVPLTERAKVNYDHPDAQETELLIAHVKALRAGESIVAPQYDFSQHTRAAETRTIAPHPVVVVEGINTLANNELAACCDLTIYVDTPADVRFARRLQRDVAERGRTVESVVHQYLGQVRPMHERYVEPCNGRADLVLSGEDDVATSVSTALACIEPLLSQAVASPRLLLLSNSTMADEPYLGWARPHITRILEGVEEALFVPYAAVDMGYETYTAMVSEALSEGQTRVVGIHTVDNKVAALASAHCVIVGGGNTFSLLSACEREGLMAPLRRAVKEGAIYVGWSAGANLAGPTIKTTNDMPIECPNTFDGLGLVPFQINPHYTAQRVAGHGGESRDQRLKEFGIRNPEAAVLALPEGMYISVADGESVIGGTGEAWCFRGGASPTPVPLGPLVL